MAKKENFWKKYKETILWIIGVIIILALALRGLGVV